MKFRNNRINYLAILKILNFYVDRLEVMSRKLGNKFFIVCSLHGFSVSFPNMHYLFFEILTYLEKYNHLKNYKSKKSADFGLYKIAKRLERLDLFSIENYLYLYGDDVRDSDSDSDVCFCLGKRFWR